MEQLAESKFTSRRGDLPIITVKKPKITTLSNRSKFLVLSTNNAEVTNWKHGMSSRTTRNVDIEWKCNKLHIHLKPGRPPLQTYADLASWNIICCCSTTKSRSGRCHLSSLAAASSFSHCTAAQLQQPWPRRTAWGDGGWRPGTHRQGARKASRPSSSCASQTRSTMARP